MKTQLIFLILLTATTSFAQQIIVNPDGTHSVVHSTGSGTGVIVNPNGTHSTIHATGSGNGIIVNPNGTHSTIHSAGKNIKVIVNANGTHSTYFSNENDNEVISNPNDRLFQSTNSDTTYNSFRRRAIYEPSENARPRWRTSKNDKP